MSLLLVVMAAWSACPDCPPAREARRIVVGADAWDHAGAIAAPFLISLALVAITSHLLSRRS